MAGKKGKSGRKPEGGSLSDKVKGRVLAAAAKLQKEYGYTIEEAMMRLCFDEKVQATVKVGIWKAYLESMVVRETKTESKVEDNRRGPLIGLPPIAGTDPALKVVGKDD